MGGGMGRAGGFGRPAGGGWNQKSKSERSCKSLKLNPITPSETSFPPGNLIERDDA